MKKNVVFPVILMVLLATFSVTSLQASHHGDHSGEPCEGFGPQTPRDITNHQGENPVVFPIALPLNHMNLCNIHYHSGAEHKSDDFSVSNGHKADGESLGFSCNMAQELTPEELKPFEGNKCKGMKPGDTIEVHWVHSSCDVAPGKSLGACLSKSCANPSLRVESQVFTVVNDPKAPSFANYSTLTKADGFHQALDLPSGTGNPVEFLGSTTGPNFSYGTCSTHQVTWSVRPKCAKVNIASVSAWCAENVFEEDYAHGVRELVVHPELLSPIGQ